MAQSHNSSLSESPSLIFSSHQAYINHKQKSHRKLFEEGLRSYEPNKNSRYSPMQPLQHTNGQPIRDPMAEKLQQWKREKEKLKMSPISSLTSASISSNSSSTSGISSRLTNKTTRNDGQHSFEHSLRSYKKIEKPVVQHQHQQHLKQSKIFIHQQSIGQIEDRIEQIYLSFTQGELNDRDRIRLELEEILRSSGISLHHGVMVGGSEQIRENQQLWFTLLMSCTLDKQSRINAINFIKKYNIMEESHLRFVEESLSAAEKAAITMTESKYHEQQIHEDQDKLKQLELNNVSQQQVQKQEDNMFEESVKFSSLTTFTLNESIQQQQNNKENLSQEDKQIIQQWQQQEQQQQQQQQQQEQEQQLYENNNQTEICINKINNNFEVGNQLNIETEDNIEVEDTKNNQNQLQLECISESQQQQLYNFIGSLAIEDHTQEDTQQQHEQTDPKEQLYQQLSLQYQNLDILVEDKPKQQNQRYRNWEEDDDEIKIDSIEEEESTREQIEQLQYSQQDDGSTCEESFKQGFIEISQEQQQQNKGECYSSSYINIVNEIEIQNQETVNNVDEVQEINYKQLLTQNQIVQEQEQEHNKQQMLEDQLNTLRLSSAINDNNTSFSEYSQIKNEINNDKNSSIFIATPLCSKPSVSCMIPWTDQPVIVSRKLDYASEESYDDNAISYQVPHSSRLLTFDKIEDNNQINYLKNNDARMNSVTNNDIPLNQDQLRMNNQCYGEIQSVYQSLENPVSFISANKSSIATEGIAEQINSNDQHLMQSPVQKSSFKRHKKRQILGLDQNDIENKPWILLSGSSFEFNHSSGKSKKSKKITRSHNFLELKPSWKQQTIIPEENLTQEEPIEITYWTRKSIRLYNKVNGLSQQKP